MKKTAKAGRKKFMEKCYKCNVKLKETTAIREGVDIYFLKCSKCGEEFYTSDELIRHDVLTGKRKLTRKFGLLGNSSIIRIPGHLVFDFKIVAGDIGVFEKIPEGILIKPIHSKNLQKTKSF